MRLATGFLIALVACLWLGLAEAASPPAPQTGACPKACNKASACDKATACNKEACNKETACSTTTACNKATACSKATACGKTAATACAGKNACDTATACQGEKGCEGASSKDAVMAAMFGDMVICGKVLQCSQLTAAADSAACELICETAAGCETTVGCETACASKKACCEAAASCEKLACQQSACAKATGCASKLTSAIACNKSTACASATACSKATPCESAAGCPATACAATGECPQVIATDCASSCESGNCCKAKAAALAVASDETCAGAASCEANACCQASACASDACSSAACPNTVKLTHLVKAAEHLAAAGLTDEADCVRAMAVEVRQELVAKKVAQIASLQAEIAALGGDCATVCESSAAPCNQEPARSVSDWMAMKARDRVPEQVSVNVKCVEVSLSMMKKLGFGFNAIEQNGWEKGDAKGILGFMQALERERLAKVFAYPTATLPDGGGFQVANQELGQLKIQAKLLDDRHVRMEVRHITGNSPAFDSGVELEFGKTAVLGGQVREQIIAVPNSNSHEPKMVRSEVQTLILLTPELVEPANAVQPASHEEPSEELGIQTHRVGQRVKALHIFETRPGQPEPRARYSFPAESR